jgi:acetyltransferase-like isoleucine patch superfamily enzyme
VRRALSFLASVLDPRAYLGLLRLVHYYNYSHVKPRRELTLEPGVRLSPNVSIHRGDRVSIGARTHVGARCHLWAGRTKGRVSIGRDCLLAPDVFLTASNYRIDPGTPVKDQPTDEHDVTIEDGVWLGARVIVLPGVTVGRDAVVAAGAVVSESLPPECIAAGVPARVVGQRGSERPDAAALPAS